MERRNKRNITIGILCTLLVFMGVGYAALNQVLDINGTARSTNTWSVLIESITKKASSDGVTSTERVGVDNTRSSDNATFSVDFIKPGDYIEYDIVVKNSGTIAGQVSEVNFTTTNTELFTTSFDNSIINKTISPGGSETFTIRIDYNSEATSLITGEEQFQLVLTSVQGEGSNITPDAGEEDDWLYKVNSDGLITSFNYNSPQAKDGNGNYVANVPAEVDGIPVTEINENSFKPGFSVLVSPDFTKGVLLDKVNQVEIMEILNKVITLQGISMPTVYEEGTIDTTGFISFFLDIDLYKYYNQTITGQNFENIITDHPDPLIYTLDLSQATNLTSIGENAFRFSNLTVVNLGNTVTTIGHSAFSNSQISELTIPNSVTTIENHAFENNQISSLTLGNGVTTIGVGAFYGNSISGELTIANSVTTIGHSAFSSNQISSLTIGSGVTSLGMGVFDSQKDSANNATLTSITIKKPRADFEALLASGAVASGWYDSRSILAQDIIYDPS